jgi:hypothetical protein
MALSPVVHHSTVVHQLALAYYIKIAFDDCLYQYEPRNEKPRLPACMRPSLYLSFLMIAFVNQ